MEIGSVQKVKITDYLHDGSGLGRLSGQVVFVPGALAGEEVLAEVTTQGKGYVQTEVKEVLLAHPSRVSPVCPVYGECGGCGLQHADYELQLEIKRRIVESALHRIGGLRDVAIRPVIGAASPWGYRNKGTFRVGRISGRAVLGFYEEGSHRLVSRHCKHLFSPSVTALLSYLEEVLTEQGFGKEGHVDRNTEIDSIMIRESRYKGETLLVFSCFDELAEEIKRIARKVCDKFPLVVGVCRNNKGKLHIVEGRDRIVEKIDHLLFDVSAKSFFQVNTEQAAVLYRKVMEYVGPTGQEPVVDAYCGTGTISLFAAQKARRVIGIESVSEAVRDAKNNAVKNNATNVEFKKGRVEDILPKLVRDGLKPAVVIVDPPRKGCDKRLLEAIIEAGPVRIVYVSCNPSTLARDIKRLAGCGYAVAEVQPVDMFPQTSHVESVVLITRVNK